MNLCKDVNGMKVVGVYCITNRNKLHLTQNEYSKKVKQSHYRPEVVQRVPRS